MIKLPQNSYAVTAQAGVAGTRPAEALSDAAITDEP
jgi:hypothetical protein